MVAITTELCEFALRVQSFEADQILFVQWGLFHADHLHILTRLVKPKPLQIMINKTHQGIQKREREREKTNHQPLP
jgi:diphthamide synthase subunit DPH2